MMTHDEMIAVIAAHRDGKRIQFSSREHRESQDRVWHEIESPEWEFYCCDYRVKPEPIEAWAVVTMNGAVFGVYQYRGSAETAVNTTALGMRIVRLIEEGGDA